MKLKKSLSALIAVVLCMVLLASCGGKNADSEATASAEASQEAAEVTVSVYVEDEDRYVLENKTVAAEEGDTAFDILQKAVTENKIHMEFEGAGGSAYVRGIDNIYAGDKGENSGWLFYVNGEKSSYGAGNVEAADGDVLEWKYVLDWEAAE